MHEYLTTSEVASLLRIKERKVYDLAASGALPCSKALGKLLFPRDQIHAWLAEHADYAEPLQTPRPTMLLGSHDPLLEWAIRESRCGLASLLDGSRDGIERFLKREGLLTGLHIYSAETQSWNTDEVELNCAGLPVVLIQWAYRQRGLLLDKNLQTQIKTLADLPKIKSVKSLASTAFIPRQAEAGAQTLLEQLLLEHGLSMAEMHTVKPARSEDDVGLAIANGVAAAGFGLASVAQTHQLHFVPVIEERFDLLLLRDDYFKEAIQMLLKFSRGEEFKAYVQRLQGYRVDCLGDVMFKAEQ